jgi:Uma2 family endonuclease
METERHRKQMTLLIETLESAWRDRTDFYVGGNMFIYFSELQAKKNDFRGPDVFVVLDTERRERKSWVVWQEGGRTPDVVIELVSPSTEAIDRGEKMRTYAKLLHVAAYYLFDPLSGVMEAYALDMASRSYTVAPPDADGTFPCPPLGLKLGVRRGVYQGLEADCRARRKMRARRGSRRARPPSRRARPPSRQRKKRGAGGTWSGSSRRRSRRSSGSSGGDGPRRPSPP